MSRKSSSLLLIICAISVTLLFQNCAPDMGDASKGATDVQALQNSGGGSGDPYEGQNRPPIFCRPVATGPIYMQINPAEDGEIALIAYVGDKVVPFYYGPAAPFGEVVDGPWSLGAPGSITSFQRLDSPLAIRVWFKPAGGAAVDVTLPCR